MAFQCYMGLYITLTILFMTGELKCQEIGPRNISRMEGEKDVFISCPFNGQYLPAWEINGKLYELFQLPEVFIPASRGVLIPVVDVSLNGTTFRCVYPAGSGFHVEESSVGELIVTPSRYAWVTQTPPSLPHFIFIDHQHTSFEKSIKAIKLKRPADPSCTFYNLQSKSGCEDASLFLNAWPINATSLTTLINSTDLVNRVSQKLAYFNISGENNQHEVCSWMKANFQIKQQVITRMLNASGTRSKEIVIPTETENTVYIVLPQPDSQSFDCSCAIIFWNGQQCTHLEKCSCIDQTMFNTSITICNSTDGLNINFENLTEAMNGYRIFFFQSYTCDDNPYRTYIASYEIMEVLPEEPIVEILQHRNESEVCVYLNDDRITVNNYEIIIYDITGEQTFYGKYLTSNKSENCTSVGNAFSQASCQPFMVSVKANNAYGSNVRNVTVTVALEFHQAEVCSCLAHNVKVDAFTKVDNNQFTAILYCNNLKYKSTVFFVVKIEENIQQNISCETVDSTQAVEFRGVDCDEAYNLSVFWIAPNEIATEEKCTINIEQSNNRITIPCSKSDTNLIIICSTVSAAALLIFIGTIVVILIVCKLMSVYRSKRQRQTYESISKQSNKSINDNT